MKNKPNFNRKDFKNFNRKRNTSRAKDQEKKPLLMCDICSEKINDISSAISIPENSNPAHFECVLKKISEREVLSGGEKLVYLGSGSFGVIRQEEKSSTGKFTIIRKIDFEDKEKVPEWRKELGIKINIWAPLENK